MTLRTSTLLPPTCAAMLPQKFSAATTLDPVPPPPAVALRPLLSQPAANAAIDTHAASTLIRGRAARTTRVRERERHTLPRILIARGPTYHKTESHSWLDVVPPR